MPAYLPPQYLISQCQRKIMTEAGFLATRKYHAANIMLNAAHPNRPEKKHECGMTDRKLEVCWGGIFFGCVYKAQVCL